MRGLAPALLLPPHFLAGQSSHPAAEADSNNYKKPRKLREATDLGIVARGKRS
jgi:hypothetical protein